MRKFIILTFLVIYGCITGLIKQISILKLQFEGIDKSLVASMSGFDFGLGFIHPFLVFAFYFISYSITLLVFSESEKEPKYLSMLIVLSLIPSFLFSLINLYYLIQMSTDYFVKINQTGVGFIVPKITLSDSNFIANTLLIIPSLVFFIHLCLREKDNLLNSFLASYFPIILITLLYKLL